MMRFVQLLPVAFIFLCPDLFPQGDYTHGFLSLGTEADENRVAPNYALYKKQIEKRYDTLFKDKEEKEEFAEGMMEDLRDHFETGEVYSNWDYANTYLNKVLKLILPVDNKDSINIKIIRSTEVNAFMSGTGQAYITVGFLANSLNEAEIASILGHEYGHFAHLDAYYRYREYLKLEKRRMIGNLLSGYGGNIFYLFSKSNTYANYRDMEREADKTGIELAQKANYNLLAAVMVEKRFKMIHENYAKTKNYQRGFYFSTHPSTDERIKYTEKAAFSSDTINSKYFNIDENAFRKIKLQAIDECINLLLQEQDFEECIEMCYKQLVFFPDSEFYLFYLNEALRRYILVDPKNADKLFITGKYVTETTYLPQGKRPLVVLSEKYPKPTDLRMGQTIFYHYELLEMADKNGLLIKLNNNELTRNDTLEFVTNQDALNYFIKRQEKLAQSSVSWVRNCQAKTFSEININSKESFLNSYNKTKDDLIACIPKTDVLSELPYIVTRAFYYGDPLVFAGKGYSKDSLRPRCIKDLKETMEPPFVNFNVRKFSVSEKQVFAYLFYSLKQYTFPLTVDRTASDKYETKELPLSTLAPEAVPLLNKHKLQQFIIADIRIVDGTTVGGRGFIMAALSYSVLFNIYYVDFQKGLVTHLYKKESISTPEDLPIALAKLNQHFPSAMFKKK